jgi:hypothetical protein
MNTRWLCAVVVATCAGACGACVPPKGAEPLTKDAEPVAVPVAPMPRAVEDTRRKRLFVESRAMPADSNEVHESNGVEFAVNLKVRRLASTGRDVIDFHWRMGYTGPRPPLIVLEPSLTETWPGTTQVTVYAFPKGSKEGRMERFETPAPADHAEIGWALRGPPKHWFVTIKKGKTATGTVPLAVADIKELLRSRYPSEFSETVPPKLYVELVHEPNDRGGHYDLDAWTGRLSTRTLEVPDLTSW